MFTLYLLYYFKIYILVYKEIIHVDSEIVEL